ncbi:MAG: hypothetical protein IBJ03_02725 [Gemmatimonadaceae bacterium]|nr:hypothetical protein [Gemmatimonadaceae bacterium]
MMKRFVPVALLLAAVGGFTGCMNVSVRDTSGALYARVQGTVTRANGSVVPNVTVGLSCVGKTADAFGQTTQANSSGVFEFPITSPIGFEPLPGFTSVCRVLTPVEGTAQAEVSVTVTYGESSSSRPTTQVTLVIP